MTKKLEWSEEMDRVNELRTFITNWGKENKCYWETSDHLVNTSIFELSKALAQFSPPEQLVPFDEQKIADMLFELADGKIKTSLVWAFVHKIKETFGTPKIKYPEKINEADLPDGYMWNKCIDEMKKLNGGENVSNKR